jgi:hypothetical protein
VEDCFAQRIVSFDLANDHVMRRIGRDVQMRSVGEPTPYNVIDLREIS